MGPAKPDFRKYLLINLKKVAVVDMTEEMIVGIIVGMITAPETQEITLENLEIPETSDMKNVDLRIDMTVMTETLVTIDL